MGQQDTPVGSFYTYSSCPSLTIIVGLICSAPRLLPREPQSGELDLDHPPRHAAEAVIGPFVEISFIATFTQRYFGQK